MEHIGTLHPRPPYNFPLTLDASAWYSGYGFAALLIFAAVVLYAFRNSLGGRPLLGAPPLDK